MFESTLKLPTSVIAEGDEDDYDGADKEEVLVTANNEVADVGTTREHDEEIISLILVIL